MAEAEKIPKIDPAEVEILIERVKQNKLEEREAELIAGLLRTLLYLAAMLQNKKVTLLRLREMIFGRYFTYHINRFGVYEWNPERTAPPLNYDIEILSPQSIARWGHLG